MKTSDKIKLAIGLGVFLGLILYSIYALILSLL